MSDLVGNPEHQFTHVMAHFVKTIACISFLFSGINFNKDFGQHILKNPLVVDSMIEKVRLLNFIMRKHLTGLLGNFRVQSSIMLFLLFYVEKIKGALIGCTVTVSLN